MKPKGKWTGFSLAEACIALALLTATIIFSATIYQTTFNAGKRLEGRLDAAYEARRQLVTLRHWLKDPDNFSIYESYSPDVPSGMEVSISMEPFETASPNRAFEDGLAQPRSMRRSLLQAKVQVTLGENSTQLTSLVGAPLRELSSTEPIRLTPNLGSATLSADATIEFTASLRDSKGQEIEDAFFLWSARPVTGVATIESVSRDGRRATFKNISYKLDGSPIYTGGTCTVGVGTTYAGQEIWSTPTELRLAPK